MLVNQDCYIVLRDRLFENAMSHLQEVNISVLQFNFKCVTKEAARSTLRVVSNAAHQAAIESFKTKWIFVEARNYI